MHSISTSVPRGNFATPTQVRTGYGLGMNLMYASVISVISSFLGDGKSAVSPEGDEHTTPTTKLFIYTFKSDSELYG